MACRYCIGSEVMQFLRYLTVFVELRWLLVPPLSCSDESLSFPRSNSAGLQRRICLRLCVSSAAVRQVVSTSYGDGRHAVDDDAGDEENVDDAEDDDADDERHADRRLTGVLAVVLALSSVRRPDVVVDAPTPTFHTL